MLTVIAARRRLLVLALVSLLVAATGGLFTHTANAASPGPTKIVIDGVSSTVEAPGGTPDGAIPNVLVAVGQDFFIDVSFYDASGNRAAFNSDTTLSITSNGVTLSPSTVVVPKGNTTWRVTTKAATAANKVSLTVQVASGKLARTVAPGTSPRLFDVMSQLRLENSARDVHFQQGIGGRANCTEATREDPVCGIVILPRGSVSDKVLLSLGACDSDYAGCGSTRGSLVQTLADLDDDDTGDLYTKSSPATLLMKCDKSLCGSGSIQSKTLWYSLKGNAALGPASACPAKGTVGAEQDACVDYVQSKRDGSGDTYLYLLFTKDARVSVH
jgi:hypothetical protein